MSLKRVLNLDSVGIVSQDIPTESVVPVLNVQDGKIPASILFNSDLKKLSGYRDLRISKKQDIMLNDFVESFGDILDYFEKSSKHYDTELVQFVVQASEDFFISHKSMGKLKEKSVVEVCKKYFNDDEALVIKIINLVFPLIKKSNIFRRNKKRINRFFLVALGMLGISLQPKP